MKFALSAFLLALSSLFIPSYGADAPAAPPPAGAQPPAAEASAPPPQAEPAKEQASVAEQITKLQKTIADDEKRLAHLKGERDDPQGEYAQAEASFDRVDKSLTDARGELEALAPGDEAKREELESRVERLTKARELTKERFDLAIEGRKTTSEQIANLTQKLESSRQALAKLEGTSPEPPAAEAAAPTTPPDPSAAPSPATAPKTGSPATPSAPAAPASAPDAAAPAEPKAAPSPPAALPGMPAPAAPPQPEAAAAPEEGKPVDEELAEAQRDIQAKAKASQDAEAEARSVADRLAIVDKDIALEQRLLDTARKRRENATESRTALTASFRERSLAGAPRDELDSLLARVHEVEERLKAANLDVRESTDRLQDLHAARSDLQAEQIASLQAAEAARDQVKVAEDEVRRLENPFSLHNILGWLIDHGPRILAILLAMAVAQVLSRFFAERVIRLLAGHGARGSSVEREARARTLVGVFHNAMSVAVVAGGGMMVLQESGIPVAPLLGGAAVFGLAVAFGAQNLIRDYFYGFVILLENQYKLNDVVQIGDLSGQVENITLRMTVLRDLEGRVHFVPNGQVTAVTNLTHGWSRALFDIGVAYKENVDHVMAVVMALARELREDPLYAPMILEDVSMLGVDSLGESSVVIKFFIKTRPLQQWSVKRELLRRIKNRFDELGIEIPFPHRTVYHRNEHGLPLAAGVQEDGQPRILRATQP